MKRGIYMLARNFQVLAVVVSAAALGLLSCPASACMGGVLQMQLSDYGLKSQTKFRVSGHGELEVGGIRLRYQAVEKHWCKVGGEACDPLSGGTEIKAGGALLRVQANARLWLGEDTDPTIVEVYPVVVKGFRGDAVASVNVHAIGREDKKHKLDRGFDEVKSNITVGSRDPETGDIISIGGRTRGIPKAEPAPKIARRSYGCGGAQPAEAVGPAGSQRHGG